MHMLRPHSDTSIHKLKEDLSELKLIYFIHSLCFNTLYFFHDHFHRRLLYSMFIVSISLTVSSLISEIRSVSGSLRLSDWFNRPAIIEAGDNYDFLIRGLSTQPEQLTDINFDPEIKHFFFRRNNPFGGDLRAIDIQRNRDHALASYNDFREFCGLRRASRWEDFLDLMSPKTVENLQSVYNSFEDVDLTVGASLEAHVEGTLAGPTFLCILTEQFYRTRVGDRYFFERGDKDLAFSRSK